MRGTSARAGTVAPAVRGAESVGGTPSRSDGPRLFGIQPRCVVTHDYGRPKRLERNLQLIQCDSSIRAALLAISSCHRLPYLTLLNRPPGCSKRAKVAPAVTIGPSCRALGARRDGWLVKTKLSCGLGDDGILGGGAVRLLLLGLVVAGHRLIIIRANPRAVLMSYNSMPCTSR
ncbi:uncharacterized protein LOC144723488 [Lampetra planeri]